MEHDRLDSLQREVLAAFFERENRFFLTGGAALAGYYLRHRSTQDLDLFTTEDHLEDGVAALTAVAETVGASMEALRTAPDFRRFLLRRGASAVVVDLVRDLVPQIFPEKPLIGGIRVDSPEEILVNKICTLLSRAEIRDLVDVRALDQRGFSVEEAVRLAARKDGGLTPGQLAWVLSQVRIGDDLVPPGEVSAAELRQYLGELRHRLAAMAFPSE